jgi:general secretion pathway protein D
MKKVANWTSQIVVAAALFVAPAAWAGNEKLDRVKQLLESNSYAEARSILLSVDRSTLSADDLRLYDQYSAQIPADASASERGEKDYADAQWAYAEGRWSEAKRLYESVLANSAARQSIRNTSCDKLKLVYKKLGLSGPVPCDGSSGPAPAPQPQPQPQPAPAAPQSTGTVTTPASPTSVQPVTPAYNEPATPSEPARPATIIDDARMRDDLLWQRAVARMEESIAKATTAVQEKHYDDARQLAAQAVQVIEANRSYAQPPSKYEDARDHALRAQSTIDSEIGEQQGSDATQEREEIKERIAERQQIQEQHRKEKIDQLFATAEQLRKEQRFSEATEAMRQVLYIDPGNSQAGYLLEIYDQGATLFEQRQIGREYNRQFTRQLLDASEATVPWAPDILYPRNWPEISARRDRAETTAVDEDFELNSKLEDVQSEVSFEDEPLEKAIDYLQRLNDVNIAVDWEDLEANGVSRDKPVSLKLKNVTLRTVLKQTMASVGGDVKIGFQVGDGLVSVASKEKLDRNKNIQVYDIRDLIIDIPKFADAPLANSGVPGNAFQNADRLFGGDLTDVSFNGSRSESENTPQGRTKHEDPSRGHVARVLDIIRTNVSPDSWRETGGGDGSLRELNGNLIVYNTSDAHRQVKDLLNQLREMRALMIGVEARFLILTSNFLEEIGVDLDFVFNQGTAGYDPAFTTNNAPVVDPFTGSQVLVPRPFSRAGISPALPPGTNPLSNVVVPNQPYGNPMMVPAPGGVIPSFHDMTPIGAQQGSLGLVNPTSLNTGIPGSIAQASSFGPALNIAGSYLDNLQVDFLIRATQANRRSSIVQAPRLMMFNGQRAWVAVTRTRQYVSTVNAQVAEGAVGVQPVQAAAISGTSLDVEGTIGHDRKYVTITVRTGVATEPTFERFEVQRASGNSPGIFILLPDQEQRSIRTTVSIPDGGTALLGGLKQVGEVEADAGIPILSKIPVLKRAFTNTTTVKDMQTLLILLKAKILIQSEAEEEAFPSFSAARS